MPARCKNSGTNEYRAEGAASFAERHATKEKQCAHYAKNFRSVQMLVYGNSLRWVCAFTYNPKDFVPGKSFARAIIAEFPENLLGRNKFQSLKFE
jgi:hypothetical protein